MKLPLQNTSSMAERLSSTISTFCNVFLSNPAGFLRFPSNIPLYTCQTQLFSPRASSELYNPISLPQQWCSQDTIDARAQHGNTTFVRTSVQSAEAFGGLRHALPEFYSLSDCFWGYTVVQYKSFTAKSCTVSVRHPHFCRYIHSDTAPFDSRPFSAQFGRYYQCW